MHLLNKQTVFKKNSFSTWCYEKIVYFYSTSSRTPQKKKQVASWNMKNKCISYFVKVKQHMQFWKKLWNYLWKNISTFCFIKVVFYWKFRFNMWLRKILSGKTEKEGLFALIFDKMSLKASQVNYMKKDQVVCFEDFSESLCTNDVANHALLLILRTSTGKKKLAISFYFSSYTTNAENSQHIVM